MAKKWEYKVEIIKCEVGYTTDIDFYGKTIEKTLNTLGEEGWELVAVARVVAGGIRYGYAILKKEKV